MSAAAQGGRGLDRTAPSKDRARALRHDAVWELVCVFEEVGETLWRVDEAADREPDEFDRQEVEQLEGLALELELQADDLGDASGILRCGVRRTLGRLRRLLEEVEEYLDDNEPDDEPHGTLRAAFGR